MAMGEISFYGNVNIVKVDRKMDFESFTNV